MKPCKTVCKPGKICNTKTGRCIKDPTEPKVAKQQNHMPTTLVCPRNMLLDNDEFLRALKSSLRAYYKHGERSNEKLKILHSYISCALKHMFEKFHMPDVVIRSLPMREDKVAGEFYNKNVDITVRYKSQPYGLVSVKFVMSNYKQNENNYFESLLGECINLKAKSKFRNFWFILITFDDIPYFNKNHFLKTLQKFDQTKYSALINNKERSTLLPDTVSITVLKNKHSMVHPSKLDNTSNATLNQYIESILSHHHTIMHSADQLDFFHNLELFTLKTITNIKTASN